MEIPETTKKQQFISNVRQKLEYEKSSELKCACGHYRSQHYYDIVRRGFEYFKIVWSECPICTCQKFQKNDSE